MAQVGAGPFGKLPKLPLGLRLGSAQPQVVVEVYIDLVCPFSRKFFYTLRDDLLPAFESKPVQFVLHQQIQPWHFQSCILHEVWAALKCTGVAAEVETEAIGVIYDAQESFMDVNVRDKTKTQLVSELVGMLAKLGGIDKELLETYLEPDTSNGQKNGGCKATAYLKIAVKHGREVSMHGSPECRINGLNARSSSSWGVEEWSEALDPLLGA